MELNRRFAICWISLLFCVIIHWTFGEEFEEIRTVETTLGKIRGKRNITWINNEVYYSFQGIPYAKTPVGNLRLRAPEPVEPWSPNVLDAFELGFTCIRPDIAPFIEKTPQDEDCLSLNIYVPARANPDNKVPVLFVIHGGGYNLMSGSDYMNGPDHLVEEDIIIVSINYRLGVLGFLSFNTPEYSGNMGLKDQQMALKWTYDHIGGFGGDNKKITISGYSAGAASAHFHLLSKESRQYINNAFLMSGSVANIWALSDENDHTAFAYKMAEEAGTPKTSFTGLINFLLNASITQLQTAGILASTFYNTFFFKMAPVIERPDAIRPFLLKEPFELYKDEVIDKDIMVSTSQMELSAFYNAYPVLYPKKLQKMHKNFTFKLPFRNMPFDPESEEYDGVIQKVREFYFGDKRVGTKTHLEYMTMISDLNFDYPNFVTIKRHIQESKGKVYALRFSVNATLNYAKRSFADRSRFATHMDETCYIFTCKGTPYYSDLLANPSSEESRISIQTIAYMVKIVTNFVKYGNPTYQDEPIAGFGPVQCFDINVLNITNHGLEIDINPRKLEVEFWDDLNRQVEKMAMKNRYRY